MSLKHSILARQFERSYKTVDVPMWPDMKGKLQLRSLNALEMEHYSAAVAGRLPEDTCQSAAIVALVLVDNHGNLVFSTEDAKQLSLGDESPLVWIVNEFIEFRKELIAKGKSNAQTTGEPGTTSPGIAGSSTPTI